MTTQERVEQNGAAFEACRDKLLDIIERAYVIALKDLREAPVVCERYPFSQELEMVAGLNAHS